MTLELANIPPRPGVYIFKGQKERVLYVGKAKNLRNRLRSYFHDTSSLDQRNAAMVRLIKDFSYIVTGNEFEALILEANLIKQYKPRFNILLRDDKNYPYIKITITEQWPGIEVVRKIRLDGSLYFGPYVPARAMWETLDFIRRNFLIRTCRYALDKPLRPCIRYQMKRCPAPCAGLIHREEYMKIIEDVILFLKGEKKHLLQKLEERMKRLSEEMRFEEAAKIRDRIFNLHRAFESQKVVAPELGDIDVVGYFRAGNDLSISIMFIRTGVMIGARDFFIENVLAEDEGEIMHSILEIFYTKEIIPAPVILVNVMPQDLEPLKIWLKNKRGEDVRIEATAEGKKLELLQLSNENARVHFEQRSPSVEAVIRELKDRLSLTDIPCSIGAFDVSTISGSESVGAFVYWERGDFQKNNYRHLRIKGVQGIDDYAMMGEIVERVLLKTEQQSSRAAEQQRTEHRFNMPLPDLIIIDGGKGQLEAAKGVMEELGMKADLIAVAKKPDRAFLIDGEIVDLEDRSSSSLLLKKIRDEAHRFAITFHRKLRDNRLIESILEKIPGIGKKRRLELLRHFGSIDNIRKATVDEIIKIKGFNKKIADIIITNLMKS